MYTTDEDEAAGNDIVHLDWNLKTRYECQFRIPVSHKNAGVIRELEIIALDREFDLASDARARAEAYRRAISTLKAYPRDVRTKEEGRRLQFVGEKIGSAITEHRRNGSIKEANAICSKEEYQTRELFLLVYGASTQTVKDWLEKGYRTIQDVTNGEVPGEVPSEQVDEGGKRKRSTSDLPKVIKYGLKYFDDLREKMTGADVEEIVGLFGGCVQQVSSESRVEAVGAYRRGHRSTISSVEILVTAPHAAEFIGLATRIAQSLVRSDLIVQFIEQRDYNPKTLPLDTFKTKKTKCETTSDSMNHVDKESEPISKLSLVFPQKSAAKKRIVHIYVVPPASRPYALLLFTGSARYVHSLRDYLSKVKGCEIATHGVWLKDTPRKLEVVETEEQLFEQIGLDWIPPELRNC